MPPAIGKLPETLKSTLAGFTAGQKMVTALALVALLVGGVMFTGWAAKPSMVPVFSNLAADDAAAITEELNARGMQYQLGDGGATVLVPQKDVYQLRLDLSAAGLPTEGEDGYEILDTAGITTSEFKQRVDYQRAVEGELSKTISSIEGVEATTVHLVMPEEALFSDDASQPSASVLVKMKPGKSMAGGQVQAVVNLVASSVEGLTPEQVTLADAEGTVLAAAGEDGMSSAAGDQRAVQTAAFESNLQASVEEMLMPVVGAGKAVVRVNAALDFDKRAQTIERFNPEDKEPQAVSETRAIENYVGEGQVIGGVLGPENVGNPALEGGDNTYDKEETARTIALDKVTEQVESAPGKVERLSVAVVLDAEAAGVIAPAEIEALVAAAAGSDAARGDVVQVSRLAFDDTAALAAEEEFAALEAAEKEAQRWSLIRTVGVLLVVGLMLLYALRVMRRDKREEVELPLDMEVRQIDLEAQAAALAAAEARRALEAAPVTVEEQYRITLQGEIGELVERQPDEVAQLLPRLARGQAVLIMASTALAVPTLTGPQKAAILLVQLGRERSALVLKSLRESEVEEILGEIARLKSVDTDVVDAVMEEFQELAAARRYYGKGGMDFAREVLEASMGPERAAELLKRMEASLVEMPFEFLRRADARQVLSFLQDEHPQTVALVLAHMRADQAAVVLSGMPDELQADVAHRVAIMENTSPEVIRRVEAILERKLSSVLQSNDFSAAGGLQPLIDIINHSDRATERLILEGLERRDPALAEEVRAQMFMFEDILTLDDRSIQLVLRQVDSKELATALKGVNSEVRGKIMSNISERAAQNLSDEIDMLGPVRIATVEEAQAVVIQTIRSLEESGQIVLSRGEGDEYVV